MLDFRADNPLLRIKLGLPDLCCLGNVKGPSTIKPEQMPYLTSVEAVKDKNAPANAPQMATRYNLVFPSSGFLRISVKVEEEAATITQEVIDKYGGAIRVSIENFVGGTFETDGGGARPYFKATKITPILPK